MTEQTEQALTESVTEIIGWVEQAKDFAVEQAPGVVQELLAWQLWSNAVGCVTFLVLAAAFMFLLNTGIQRLRVNEYSDSGIDMTIIGGIGLAVTALGVPIFGLAAVKVLIAPKLVVLEALKGLL